ncbi:MAG: LacI family transcriptional regulator [Atopostipes sp.]|nr:LacI family transcriptional regulator [Tetragenococcus koreensis]MDN6161981.1 LacI family transcriptional regulator [Atopostipes sp.]
MATIYDVADKAGYSIATVSKVLNNNQNVSDLARNKVLDAIQELDYIPNSSARTLVTKQSKMIGVVLGIELNHPFFSPVLEELRAFSDMYNYDLLFVSRRIEGEENFTD